MEEVDYYSILQIGHQATQEEVRAAYKRLALLHHPDRSSHPRATEFMQKINQAFAVLGSPEKRLEYDQQSLSPQTSPEPPADVKTQTCPVQSAPVVSAEAERQRFEWLRGQFKTYLGLIVMVMLLFFWSLLTGEVSLVAVLLLVAAALYTVASIIFKIRKPLAR